MRPHSGSTLAFGLALAWASMTAVTARDTDCSEIRLREAHAPPALVRLANHPGVTCLRALDHTTNWAHLQRRSQLAEDLPAEVRAVIGQRVTDLPAAPAGTEFWTPERSKKRLRWKRDQAAGRPSLSLDSHGASQVPVTLVQDTIDVGVRYDADGRPKSEYSKSDYVAVQLANYTDVFDAERSLYRRWPDDPDAISVIRKRALQVPPEGLPPLFRMSVYPIHIFVSAEARVALDNAGIRGPVYVPLDKISP